MMRWIKHIGSAAANSAAFEKFVGLLEQTEGARDDLVRVLTYHRVDEPQARPWLDPGLVSASPQAFEAQVRYLAANYELVSALDVKNAFEGEGKNSLPARAVLITFDDAYRDFEEHAWPILRQYHAPAVLFVPTAFPDHPERWFWWDRVFHALDTTDRGELNLPIGQFPLKTPAQRRQAFKRLKNHIKTLPDESARKEVEQLCNELGVNPQPNCVLGWNSLQKLSKEGLTLGAHTRTHPILNHITPDAMHQEITASIHDLERETGLTPQTFAYPSGIHNEDVVKAAEQAGVRLAFTTERGINELGRANRLRLRRINIGARTTIPVLRAQLLSWTANLYPSSKPL
jgi:peptidoglycan/xylan/chitin deacetylase (PgdA/CDA1 family)